MFKVFKEELELGGKKLILETGKIARQADGAIIATCGETVVISTVVGAKKVNPETDYFPLQVNYQEKYYAAGKIPGGYFKREARPTESETLISRLIDRPIRPLFPENFRNEVQILPTVLSYDNENEADILSIIASSAALAISGLPFQEPIAASRVGYINNNYVLNPSKEELKESKLDLVVAGTKDAVLMVESEASSLTEKQMLDAVKFGHEKFIPVIKAIESLAKKSSKEAWKIEEKDYSKLKNKISKELTKDLEKAFSEKDKKKRSEMITLATEKCKSLFEGDETYSELEVMLQLKHLEKDIKRLNEDFEELIFQIDDLKILMDELTLSLDTKFTNNQELSELDQTTTQIEINKEENNLIVNENSLGDLVTSSENLSDENDGLVLKSNDESNINIKQSPEDEFQQAIGLIMSQEYDDAIISLKKFIDNNKESNLAGSAHYWLGEIYIFRKGYRDAAIVLLEGYQKYPNSVKAPDMLYQLSESLINIEKYTEACNMLKTLSTEYPEYKLLDKSQARISELGCIIAVE